MLVSSLFRVAFVEQSLEKVWAASLFVLVRLGKSCKVTLFFFFFSGCGDLDVVAGAAEVGCLASVRWSVEQ